jgi:hypothetical protein
MVGSKSFPTPVSAATPVGSSTAPAAETRVKRMSWPLRYCCVEAS